MAHEQLRHAQPKIELDSVRMRYQVVTGYVDAVDNVSFSLAAGDFVSILGPSGCGKTTLLRLIAGYINPTAGEVLVDGKQVRGPGADRGVVSQQHTLFPWKTVRQNVEFGSRLRALSKVDRNAIVDQYLEEIGLSSFAKYYPSELSEGMRQRVGIVRAFANEPDILLMDEPFAALDAQTSEHMQGFLHETWVKSPKTIVFITHNIEEAVWLSNRVILLTAHPTKVHTIIPVDIPHPRSRIVIPGSRHYDILKEIRKVIFS